MAMRPIYNWANMEALCRTGQRFRLAWATIHKFPPQISDPTKRTNHSPIGKTTYRSSSSSSWVMATTTAVSLLLQPKKTQFPSLPQFPVSPPPAFRVSVSRRNAGVLIARCSLPGEKVPNLAPKVAPNGLLSLFFDSLKMALHALKKPAAVAVVLGLLLIYDPGLRLNPALAASGGRMGGSSFSSRSSSSSSRSYTTRTPNPGFSSYTAPYYGPSPFGGGFYVGPAVGVGAGSSFFLILMGFAAFVVVSGFLSDKSEDGGLLIATEKTSVLKLQVGLLGMGRSLQKDLNRIADLADTSSPEGLRYVLTEATLALLRHPDYCISGYSLVDVKRSMEDGEKRFNQLSIEERGKFDEETLVNVNNIRKLSIATQRSSGFSNEYIVITILVAAEGVHKLPTINGSGDLKEALQRLGSIPSSKILAVEILWTPQNENDTLSERELLEDYSLLRPL